MRTMYTDQAGRTIKCTNPPIGWWCSGPPNHDGPCPARPRWWNLSRSAVKYRLDGQKVYR